MALKNESKKGIASIALLEVGLFEIGFVVVVIALILGVLNYFNIISLSQLYPDKLGFLPHQPFKESVQTPVQEPIFVLKCPVPLEFCNSAEKVTYKGNPGLAYKLPDKTTINSIAPVVDSLRFFEQPYKPTNPQGFYQSYIDNNYCYAVTYIFPYDANLKKIDLLPLIQGTQIATSGASANAITVNNKSSYQLVLQIQKRKLGIGQYDFQKCPVKNLEPKDFGTYEKLDKNTFK